MVAIVRLIMAWIAQIPYWSADLSHFTADPANTAGKQQMMAQEVESPATYTGALDGVPGPCLWPDSTLAIGDIYRVNWWTDLSLSLFLPFQ